jgi:hypothetical protein
LIDIDNVEMRLSVSAAAGNTTAGTPATSLGDQVSTTEVVSGVSGNVWDNVPSAEASTGATQYRCVFLVNTDAATLFGGYATVQAQTAGGSTLSIGLDPVGITPVGSSSAQAATIASETSAPAGVTFGNGPLNFGDLATQQAVAVWIKRVTPPGATTGNDSLSIRVAGDSLP